MPVCILQPAILLLQQSQLLLPSQVAARLTQPFQARGNKLWCPETNLPFAAQELAVDSLSSAATSPRAFSVSVVTSMRRYTSSAIITNELFDEDVYPAQLDIALLPSNINITNEVFDMFPEAASSLGVHSAPFPANKPVDVHSPSEVQILFQTARSSLQHQGFQFLGLSSSLSHSTSANSLWTTPLVPDSPVAEDIKTAASDRSISDQSATEGRPRRRFQTSSLARPVQHQGLAASSHSSTTSAKQLSQAPTRMSVSRAQKLKTPPATPQLPVKKSALSRVPAR